MRAVLALILFSLFVGNDKVADFALDDTAGKRHTLYEHKDAKAVVLVFLGAECPMSQRYPPRLTDLHAKYKDVVFYGVDSNLECPTPLPKLPFPILLDRHQEIADRLQVSTIPCAIVIDSKWEIRYRGRIDDHKSEDLVRNRYLRDAIDAVLAGAEVKVKSTEAVGCSIQRKRAESSSAVTYSNRIAKLLNENCASCHRPGQVAPFSLLSYEDAKRWSVDLADAAKDKRMPPWRATNHGTFRGERVLSEPDIAALQTWADAGAPLGNPKEVPETPKFPDGWMLGTPDLVLTCEEYEVPAKGDDEYRCFVLPTNLPEDVWISAVEMRPGNMNVLHHIIGYVDSSGQADKNDADDPQPGYRSSGTGPGFIPSGDMGGWAPGNFPYALPDGVGRLLKKGSRIVLEIHYHKNGRKEKDRTQVGLHFAKKKIEKRLRWLELINWSFRIEAGAKRHKVVARHTVSEDLHAHFIIPHMHLIGREITVEAEFPDKTKKVLIRIDDWDFNWQDTYTFREPVALPKGTKLVATAYYDNSEENVNNPNRPPKTVTWGEQTTDEMNITFVGYTRDRENLEDE